MQLEGMTKVLGVELNALGDQLFSCRFCVVAKKAKLVNIEVKDSVIGTLATVLAKLPKKMPTALVLSGKGIVHKSQAAAVDSTNLQLFSSAFPSVEEQQFYAQFFREKEATVTSIARRQEVDEILDRLGKAGLKIYAISFGAMLTQLIWPQLNSYGNEIQFDGHFFQIGAEKQFLSYQAEASKRSTFPIKIGQEVMPEENIVAYAAAFQLLLHEQVDLIVADIAPINEGFSNFLTIAKLKQKAMVFLFVLFGALLLSFAVFSYYNQQNLALTKAVGSKLALVDQADVLRKNAAENEALLRKLNWSKGYNQGFLINEIGKSMPKQLTLTEITVNEFKSEEAQLERVPTIYISGFTDNLTAVNNWIFLLKEKEWIESVKLAKFQEDPETANYQFNLLINY